MENIDDLVLREKISKYEQTRKRVEKCHRQHSISDKEIIEYLADEIEQYRNKIKQQTRIIDNLSKLTSNEQKIKNIETERNTYHCAIDKGTGKDFSVIRWYEDGVLIKEEIKPCE